MQMNSIARGIVRFLQSSKEDCYGAIYRSGRSRAQLHYRGHGTFGEASPIVGGRNERRGGGGGNTEHLWAAACMSRGGDAERVAARAPESARKRDRGDGAAKEQRTEGRLAGRVGVRGRDPNGIDRNARVQGAGAP